MSTLRFDIAGGSYAVGCGISKSCSGTGFAVALGAGALGGAISGGVGSAMVGSMASYTATSIAYGDGPTVGGYAGGIAGGSSSLLIGDGALTAAGGGFAGGVTGAAMSSGNSDPSKMLVSGLVGAGMGFGHYLMYSSIIATSMYLSEDHETGFSKKGLNEIYDKQNSISPKDGVDWDKQEFVLIRDKNGERDVRLEYDVTSNNNKLYAEYSGKAKLIHTHGEYAEYKGPSPGDYRSIRNGSIPSNIQPYVLNTQESKIYEYNSNKIVATHDYSRNANYRYYFNKTFRW